MSSLSIRAIIDQRAAESPDAVYLIDPDSGETVTYLNLRDSCRAICQRLAASGIQPGESVAYAMTNGTHAAQTILGILYGGYLATAVNLVSGKQTIAYVLKHSEAKAVFHQKQTVELLNEAVAPDDMPLLIPVDGALLEGDTPAEPKHAPAVTDDGLLMYTSGTTGVPKGVLLTHGNLAAGGRNAVVAHGLTEQDRGLCVLPLYHINGLCVSVLGALVSGGGVIIPNRFSVRQFWSQLKDQKGTWFSVVPTQISYLLQDDNKSEPRTEIDGLRFGRSASAPLAPEIQRSFEQKFGVPIVETMGLTETAAQILSNPLPPGVRVIGSPGVAVGNEVIIVDTEQKELPRGEEGEVLVRGSNVMRGYLKNQEATDASITPEGWLRTGDLGRMDEDGYVFITGRLKELIIKGGENIAPREIDDALYTHPDVVEAAAFARICREYGQTVEAGVMLREGSKVTAEALIEICQARIGAFKAPDRIHFLPELPKGPSGKIQRLRLAEIARQ